MEVSKEEKDKIIEKQISMYANDKVRQKKTKQRENYRQQDILEIKKLGQFTSLICLGARDDSEVLSFINNGFESRGLDIAVESTLIHKRDLLTLENYDMFDVCFCSHVLEHVYDPEKAFKVLRSITKSLIWIILPICEKGKIQPTIKHPTIYEIMKKVRGNEIFLEKEKNIKIWKDFNCLEPYEIVYGKFRKGVTEKNEVVFGLKLL